MSAMLIPLADGVEEMEAVIVIDVLRRAGWNVIAAAVGDSPVVTASRGVTLTADCLWQDAVQRLATIDGIVIPGGAGGTQALCRHEGVLECLRTFGKDGRLIGAICAGPLVLQAAGILHGRRYTCYPGVERDIAGACHCNEKTVRDDRLITSQGPGTAFDFALALIEALDGATKAAAIRRQLVLLA